METRSWLVTAFVTYRKLCKKYGLWAYFFASRSTENSLGFNDSLDFKTHSSMKKLNQNLQNENHTAS